jgi:hypothetical protein
MTVTFALIVSPDIPLLCFERLLDPPLDVSWVPSFLSRQLGERSVTERDIAQKTSEEFMILSCYVSIDVRDGTHTSKEQFN